MRLITGKFTSEKARRIWGSFEMSLSATLTENFSYATVRPKFHRIFVTIFSYQADPLHSIAALEVEYPRHPCEGGKLATGDGKLACCASSRPVQSRSTSQDTRNGRTGAIWTDLD
eukprot:809857-Prorocentrum_minimum.AAC.1